jgi:hypothetical protein
MKGGKLFNTSMKDISDRVAMVANVITFRERRWERLEGAGERRALRNVKPADYKYFPEEY